MRINLVLAMAALEGQRESIDFQLTDFFMAAGKSRRFYFGELTTRSKQTLILHGPFLRTFPPQALSLCTLILNSGDRLRRM